MRGFREKITWLFLFAVLFTVQSASAQILVGVKCGNIKYMVGVNIPLKITVINNTGEPLVFSKDYNNATLTLELEHDANASGIADKKQIKRDIVILTGDTMDTVLDVREMMSLINPGAYQVKASVDYSGKVYTSRAYGFDIVQGIELLSRKRMLPGYSDIVLTHRLKYLGREGKEDAFFIIKDDDRDIIYGTFNLGPIVRIVPPVMKFDGNGRVIVVHQSGHSRFTRSVIKVTVNGAKFEKQTYHRPNGDIIKQYKALSVPEIKVPPEKKK